MRPRGLSPLIFPLVKQLENLAGRPMLCARGYMTAKQLPRIVDYALRVVKPYLVVGWVRVGFGARRIAATGGWDSGGLTAPRPAPPGTPRGDRPGPMTPELTWD